MGDFAPRDIWQYLQTFLIVRLREYYWYFSE